MRNALPALVVSLLMGCGADSQRACTIIVSGSITRSDACTSKNTKVMGLVTASDLNWLAQFEDDTILTNILFQLPTTVTATTYTGGPDVPWCTATVTLKGGVARNANSRPNSSGMTSGSCSITFTRVMGESSGTTKSFVVAGTATASVVNPTVPDSLEVNINF